MERGKGGFGAVGAGRGRGDFSKPPWALAAQAGTPDGDARASGSPQTDAGRRTEACERVRGAERGRAEERQRESGVPPRPTPVSELLESASDSRARGFFFLLRNNRIPPCGTGETGPPSTSPGGAGGARWDR